VELVSRSVYGLGHHLFFRVTPNNPNEINPNGFPAGTAQFTLGAYNPDFYNPLNNRLVKDISYENDPTPIGSADFNLKNGASVEINPVNGQNDTQFINSLVSGYQSLPDNQNYVFTGQRPGREGYSNSNNFIYQLGKNVGVGDQVKNFNAGYNTFGQSVGLGIPNQPSVLQWRIMQLQYAIFNLQQQLYQLLHPN